MTDWISVTKAKYSKIKKDREKTGGGPHCGVELSPLEERLMAIKGFTCVEGDATTPEMGVLPLGTDRNEASTSEVVSTPSNQSEIIIIEEIPYQTPKAHNPKTSIKTIQEMHEETLHELRNINFSMQSIAECLVNISNSLNNDVTEDI